ncbi:MAG: 30S ribosomal protein S18 [Candidatus Omnitrophota bacterium]
MIDKKLGTNKFKKSCVFCKKDLATDYKDVDLLSRYLSAKGKVLSRRISGNCAKHQRKLMREIKRARFLSMLPYIGPRSH